MKTAVVEYARGRQIGEELGVGEDQISAWSRGGRGAPGGRLREVAVIADAGAAQARMEQSEQLGKIVLRVR